MNTGKVKRARRILLRALARARTLLVNTALGVDNGKKQNTIELNKADS